MAHFLFYVDIISNETDFPFNVYHEFFSSADVFHIENNFLPKDAVKYIYDVSTKKAKLINGLTHEIFRVKNLLPKDIPKDYKLNFPENLFFHMHSAVEITFIIDGSIVYITNNSFIELSKGEFVLFGPNTPHTWSSLNSNKSLRAISFYFYPNILIYQHFNNVETQQINNFLNSSMKYHIVKKENPLAREFFDLLLECDNEYSEKKNGFQTIIRSNLLKIIYKMVRENSTCIDNKRELYKNQLHFALEYINDNFCNKLSLNEVSSIIHMTPNYFSSYFKKNIGVSFVKYITRLRLSKAYEMLFYTDSTISHIAQECGFETISNFNKAFGEFYHLSPSQIRKQNEK